MRTLHKLTAHFYHKTKVNYLTTGVIHLMTVHRYNASTREMDLVPDARGEYFNTKTGRWEHWDSQNPRDTGRMSNSAGSYKFYDRYDRIKKIWMQDVYYNDALSRTQERGWATKPLEPPSSHSPLCECDPCMRAKRVADMSDHDEGDTDTVHTTSCACTACVIKRAAARDPEEHTYKGEAANYHSSPYGQTRTYTSYAPSKLYDKLDRKKWPNTWEMLVTFTFQPDYYKDTRVQPEQQEYTLYGG